MSDFRNDLRRPDCTLCPLHQSAEYVCLMGSGPLDARVMIVGEAPGAREDESHEAFVGPSGQLLRRSLEGIADLNPDDCYITNTAKCRPPNNRTPERGEAKACSREYLWPEVQRVKPDFILLLGNTALTQVFGRSGITRHNGHVFSKDFDGHTAQCMATMHPAAVLRNPKWGQAFAMDLQRFGKLVKGDTSGPKTKVVLIDNWSKLKALRERLRGEPRIAFDLETYTVPAEKGSPIKRSGVQEWHGELSQIVSISFTWREGFSAVVLLHHDDAPADWAEDPDKALLFLKPVLERRDTIYIAHNGKFDCRWLHAKGIEVPLKFDTMLAAHLLEENRPKSLKFLSRTLLGAGAYDVGEDIRNARSMNVRKLVVYNGKDTDYTLRLYHNLRPQLANDRQVRRIFAELIMPASRALVEIERRGVWLDQERWQARHDEARDRAAQLYSYIERWVPESDRPINLNSPAQVGRLLFDHLGLPVLLRTAKGAPSTAETVLLRLAGRHKAATALIKYRKWTKFLNTYLLPWWYEHKDSDGRIHSNYKLFGTVTGRLSGEGGIQQVPRDPFIRSIIGAPPGWTFVQADYSQVELRIAAMIARERNMLAQYQRGEDIHMIRACRMTGKVPADVTKEERKKAKAVNFGYIYGMGAKKFVTYAFDNYGIELTQDEAEKDRNGFFDDYPALRPWHERQRRLANRYGQVSSPLGRIRHLPDIVSADQDVRAECERQAINSPVQSMASDLMLFSLIRLHEAMPPREAMVLGTVHDSILFQVRDDVVDKWCRFVKDIMEDMERVERVFGCEVTVPIVADIEIGTHWGETKEWSGG